MDTTDSKGLNDVLDMYNTTLHNVEESLKYGHIYKNTFGFIRQQLKDVLNDIPYKRPYILKKTLYDLQQVLEASIEDKKKDQKRLK